MRDDLLDGSGPQPFLDSDPAPLTPFSNTSDNKRDAIWRSDAANLPIFASPTRNNKEAGKKRLNMEHLAIEGLPEDVAKERVRVSRDEHSSQSLSPPCSNSHKGRDEGWVW